MNISSEDRARARDERLFECHLYEECRVRSTDGFQVHECFELIYILDGAFELASGSCAHALDRGAMALIHPMEPHRARAVGAGKNACLLLKVAPEALCACAEEGFDSRYLIGYSRFGEPRLQVLAHERMKARKLDALLNVMVEEARQAAFGYELALRTYAFRLMLWFVREWQKARAGMPTDDRSLARMKNALDYIDAHLSEELRVQDVADAAGVAVSTFSRFFAASAGMSYTNYVRIRRLQCATKLLFESEQSIAQIAEQTGFKTASYLILCFRNQYGITPSQFRRK